MCFCGGGGGGSLKINFLQNYIYRKIEQMEGVLQTHKHLFLLTEVVSEMCVWDKMCLLSLADEVDVDKASVASKESKGEKLETSGDNSAGEMQTSEGEDKGRKSSKEESQSISRVSSGKSEKGQRLSVCQVLFHSKAWGKIWYL